MDILRSLCEANMGLRVMIGSVRRSVAWLYLHKEGGREGIRNRCTVYWIYLHMLLSRRRVTGYRLSDLLIGFWHLATSALLI